MQLAVSWDRVDVMRELIGKLHVRQARLLPSSTSEPTVGASTREGRDSGGSLSASSMGTPSVVSRAGRRRRLSSLPEDGEPAEGRSLAFEEAALEVQCALQLALELERVAIVELLLCVGAAAFVSTLPSTFTATVISERDRRLHPRNATSFFGYDRFFDDRRG